MTQPSSRKIILLLFGSGMCLPAFAADPVCFLKRQDGSVIDLSFLCGSGSRLLSIPLVPFKPPETFGVSLEFVQDFEGFVAKHPEEAKNLKLQEVVEHSRKICDLYEEGTIGEYRKNFEQKTSAQTPATESDPAVPTPPADPENTKQENNIQPLRYTIGYEAARALGTKHLCPEFEGP